MTRRKKILIIILTAVSVLIVAATGAAWYFKSSLSDTMKSFSSEDFIRNGSDSSGMDKMSGLLASSDSAAGKLTGNYISILITGVDSRIGNPQKHADANHLIKVWPDSAKVEIISIPRASSVEGEKHYLANIRAVHGRDRYFSGVQQIAGIDTVNYYIEFGLSQAVGLIELLGFKKNAVQVLRVLRARKSFAPGDYQRVFNQGQFIRQMLLNILPKLSDLELDLLLRSGLMMVDTNLDIDIIKKIIKQLKNKGYPHNEQSAFVRIMPEFRYKLRTYNFSQKESIDTLYKYVARRAPLVQDSIKDEKLYFSRGISDSVLKRLRSLIRRSVSDSAKYPKRVLWKLKVPFQQRAWYQINNEKARNQICEQMCTLLIDAYYKKKDTAAAEYVKQVLTYERGFKRISDLLEDHKKIINKYLCIEKKD